MKKEKTSKTPWHKNVAERLCKEGLLQPEPIPEQLKSLLNQQPTKDHKEGFADGVVFAQLGASEVQLRLLRRLVIVLEAQLRGIRQRLEGVERVVASGYTELPVEFVALTHYTEGFMLAVAKTKQWVTTHPAPKGRGNDYTDDILCVLYKYKTECEQMANTTKLANFILGHFRNERIRRNIVESPELYCAFLDQVRTWCKRLRLKLNNRGRPCKSSSF